jgi:prepilin-type processing-associated H-X9-DG protein
MKALICPADKVANGDTVAANENYLGQRRSYAMVRHNMGVNTANNMTPNAATDWPPGSQNKTGMGVQYDYNNVTINQWVGDRTPATFLAGNSQQQAAMRESMILDSAGTILLTEKIDMNNVQGNQNQAHIPNANGVQHIEAGHGITEASFHNNRFNYLLFDGHVTTLEPVKTLGTTNTTRTRQTGMWTVLPGD